MKREAEPYSYERSIGYVLWLLARKAYTRAQLRDKLEGKGADPEVVARVMERLEELRYVDDEGYAEAYIRSRQSKKGSLALRRELFQKGVSEEVIDKTVGAIEPASQLEMAVALLQKQAWRFHRDDPRKRYAKAYAFLARRGFTGDVVKEALEKAKLLEEG